MSIPQKLIKVIQNLYSQIVKQIRSRIKRGMAGVLRNLVGMGHRARTSEGFILPTVTMVILVVLLLTTAIVFRSFDRSRNASNVRVNQALLNAAAPAMERASIKLDTLFDDPRLPRSTPSDPALYDILASDNDKYTFEGEERLKLAFDLNEDNSITQEGTAGRLEQWETLSTAWRFPVDTDGNGIFDSFTLYGIYFRSPDRNTQGEFTTGRTPLDVRTPPQDEGIGSGFCAAALSTSAKLVTQAGWYKSGSKLKKSFIVYTATVPITDKTDLGIPSDKLAQYENSTGNKGISVLEYQQDRARIPLSNNAVVFEDDLTIVAGENFYLNGRVMTNSNIFAAPARSGVKHQLYQVSSPKSCFYDQENSKILVGGNILNSLPLQDSVTGPAVPVDLFVADANPNEEDLTSTNQSTASSEKPQEIVYNSKAYTDRINFLVNSWIADHALPSQPNTGAGVPNTDDPDDVQTQVKANQASEAEAVRVKALTNWFKDRTRRVPFKEVPFDPTGTPPSFPDADKPKGTGNALRPPKEWMFPVDPSNGKTARNYAEVELDISGDSVKPPATEPETQRKENKEISIGDRALVGNNLPAKWYQLDDYATYDSNNDGIFVADEGQPIVGTLWDRDDSNPPQTRQRFTRVSSLGDVGDKGRDGFWEKAAATAPKNILEGVGGLRVVTGAGIYERKNSFLPPPVYQNPTTGTTSTTYDDPTTGGVVETFPVVWPDTMPMSPGLVLPASFSDELNPWVYNNKPGVEGWIRLTSATDRSNADTAAKTIDRSTPRYAKGDLRMRATAVYHYAEDIYQDPNEGTDQAQAPIACVSSYYDPSYYLDKNGTIFDSTKNLNVLPDNNAPNGKSNNGISYSPPSPTSAGVGQLSLDATTNQLPGTDAAITLNGKLAHQGNLVFPNGRFVNPLLRQALQKPHNQRSLSEQSAIDSTICAIQILDGTLSPDATVIPHGAIKEVAFLDARQVQRLDEDNPTTPKIEPFEQGTQASNYDLSLAQRQPLEIRATQIDLDKLRNKTISVDGSIVPAPPPDGNEYLLPNSGIIYATRDDAQPDLSAPPDTTLSPEQRKATQLSESKVDYRLDPTRRPNGIMLINGESLARGNSQDFREVEKGLILATDLPAYVYKDFNLHTEQEFDQTLDDWANFYSRSTPNENFACRPNDDRLPDCLTGDEWRAATVISDAITLLSNNFRFGYRNEGDYDLRNNQGWAAASARRDNGFFDNNYVTNGLSSQNPAFEGGNFTDANYTAAPAEVTGRDSTYFNNFVTPVQRRGQFREYVMEICRKLPVSECQPADWVVGLDNSTPPDGDLEDTGVTPDTPGTIAGDVITQPVERLGAGTTARPPLQPEDQRYPRRVAFERTPSGSLVLDGSNLPIPLGIDNSGNVVQAGYSAGVNTPATVADNALWFRVTNATPPVTGDNYSANRRLFYLPPENEGEELLLPNIPEPSNARATTYPTYKTAIEALNGPDEENPTSAGGFTANNDPADFSVCTGSVSSVATNDFSTLGGGCSGAMITDITTRVISPLVGLTYPPGSTTSGSTTQLTPILPTPTTPATLPTPADITEVKDNFYIYSLPPTITGNLTLTGNRDTVFVFQASANVAFNDVTLTLNGVDPNNVFWVLGSNNLTLTGTNPNTNQLAGNFLGTGTLTINANTDILGGRFLGFNTATINNSGAGQRLALTSQNQPLLVPVLQVNVSQGYTFFGTANKGNKVESTNWQPRASETQFNLIAAAGNTPMRTNEADGGLPNFPRFLENWNAVNAGISGSLLEFDRSAYATGPFRHLLSISGIGNLFNYPLLYNSSNDNGLVASYAPPNRPWGYDVGLLSQLPDLFAARFTTPPSGPPDVFFQEVSRNDEWIKTLLCGRVWNSTYKSGDPAINNDQRPTAYCKDTTDE